MSTIVDVTPETVYRNKPEPYNHDQASSLFKNNWYFFVTSNNPREIFGNFRHMAALLRLYGKDTFNMAHKALKLPENTKEEWTLPDESGIVHGGPSGADFRPVDSNFLEKSDNLLEHVRAIEGAVVSMDDKLELICAYILGDQE